MRDLGADALAWLLADQWDFRDVVFGQRLQTYPTRTAHRIATEQGRFAVKVDDEPVRASVGSEEVQTVAARALPRNVAQIRPSASGALSVIHRGHRFTVYEDISGGWPPATAQTWRQIGTILAKLHAIAAPTHLSHPCPKGDKSPLYSPL